MSAGSRCTQTLPRFPEISFCVPYTARSGPGADRTCPKSGPNVLAVFNFYTDRDNHGEQLWGFDPPDNVTTLTATPKPRAVGIHHRL